MAFSPFPVRPWPFEWVPTPPAQDWYGAGHQIARQRWMMATFLQLFLEAERAGRQAFAAARCNCPRRYYCAVGRMHDYFAAIVRYLPEWGFVHGAPARGYTPKTLPEAIALAGAGARMARALARNAPLAPAALQTLYNLGAAGLRWAQRRPQISAALPPPWRPAPRLRPVDCLTGAEGCN